jgi:phosphotransferase system enzyme I (PtsI)
MTDYQTDKLKTLRGIPVSSGIMIGKAHLVDRSKVKILYQYLISDDSVIREVDRFKKAVKKAGNQLITLKNNLPEHIKDHAFILESHRMILEDSMLYDSTIKHILDKKINAEWALKKSFGAIKTVFEQIDDEYISHRVNDVENVIERILRNLTGKENDVFLNIKERVIIVTHDLSPGDTTELNTEKVMGFITNVGGKTSHTAIMAQAIGLPAVMGLGYVTDLVEEGTILIVDGNTGDVIINPDDNAIIHYHDKQVQREKYQASIISTSHLPAKTTDGHTIMIMANTEFLDESSSVRKIGGEGIGLYRTEFLYLKTKKLPSEEELFNNYKQVAELIFPDPVIIRTLDLGGDKVISREKAKEVNPALGLRAIRLSLKNPEMFKSQLRAILRASVLGNIKMMFPMISGLKEIIAVNEILTTLKKEFDDKNIEYDHDIKVGIMIEIPSAVIMAEVLAHQVDFFSIGTNDLIQYALAIDRVNEDVSYLYEPFHPAVLKMISQVVTAANKTGIEVSLCGEMSGDPLCTSILLGMGLKILSINVTSIPLIKKIIRAISIKEAQTDFENVMKLNTAGQIHAYISDRIKGLLPELEISSN